MLANTLLGIFLSPLEALTASSQGYDLHLDQNANFLAMLYYMRELDYFLPITNAVLPLIALSLTITAFFTAKRLVGAISIAGFSLKL